jgi:hypothetical protein
MWNAFRNKVGDHDRIIITTQTGDRLRTASRHRAIITTHEGGSVTTAAGVHGT